MRQLLYEYKAKKTCGNDFKEIEVKCWLNGAYMAQNGTKTTLKGA